MEKRQSEWLQEREWDRLVREQRAANSPEVNRLLDCLFNAPSAELERAEVEFELGDVP